MTVKKAQTTKKKTATKRKPTARKKQTESFIAKTQRTFNDGRTKLLLAGLAFFFAIMISLAFISFLISWKGDQSFLEASDYMTNADLKVENHAGTMGASLAHFFIYQWFGIASFSIVFILFVISLNLFNIKFIPLGKTIKYSIIATLWLSISLSFIFGNKLLVLGGSHGYHISNWLVSFLGTTGTAFLLFILLASFILFTFDNSYTWLLGVMGISENKELETVKTAVDKQVVNDVPAEENEEVLSLGTNINLDTNELIETVDRKRLRIYDDGKVEDKDDLGFEVENTIKENEQKNPSDSGLVLDVKKFEDIQAEEFDEEPYDPTKELSNYKFPPIELLDDHMAEDAEVTNAELLENKNKIVETLRNYKIEITKIKATIGPTITLYEIIPAPGVRIAKIKNLEDDIALSLSALGIRIIAPMPGRGTIGIEVPNRKPKIVSMRSVISSLAFQESKYELPIVLGKTISNESFVVDLTKMPHLLVAGATGQGKSVGLNAIITSILYKKHPAQVKFIFVDPKKVELTLYEKIEKHFLAKLPDSEDAIITNNTQVINTLNSLSKEMDSRYDLLKLAAVRNIKEYNNKFISRRLNPLKGHRFLPYLILVVDEFADLIMTAGKEIEMPIARLAQLARAVGIHLIIATQRPSTNIITGTIKANFPSRIAFKVASMIDSRTILDSPGANHLIGRGDMLISEGSDMTRLQCAFIDTPELDRITAYISSQQSYGSALILPEYDTDDDSGVSDIDLSKRDELFEDAARIIVLHQQGSTSLIQRKMSIGYNRAGRIIDQLEAAGIVGPFEGSKARQVLMPDEYTLEQFLKTI